MLQKNLVSFEPTTFSQKLTLYLLKTNSHSNGFFFELDSTDSAIQNLLALFCYFIYLFIYFFCLRPRHEKSSKTKYINALQKHLVAMTRCQRKTNKVTKVSQHLKIIKMITCTCSNRLQFSRNK